MPEVERPELIIGVASSELELDSAIEELLDMPEDDEVPAELLDAAIIIKLPQDIDGLSVTLVLPHVTALKVTALVPGLQNGWVPPE